MSLSEYPIDPAQPGGPSFVADKDANGKLWPYGKVAYGVHGDYVVVSPLTPLPVTITAGDPDTGQALGNAITPWQGAANSPAARVLTSDDARLSIVIQNFGSIDVWVGDATTVAGKGTRLLPGQGMVMDRAPRSEVWCFSAGPCNVGGIAEKLVG
jgi:hypothetical protein